MLKYAFYNAIRITIYKTKTKETKKKKNSTTQFKKKKKSS